MNIEEFYTVKNYITKIILCAIFPAIFRTQFSRIYLYVILYAFFIHIFLSAIPTHYFPPLFPRIYFRAPFLYFIFRALFPKHFYRGYFSKSVNSRKSQNPYKFCTKTTKILKIAYIFKKSQRAVPNH